MVSSFATETTAWWLPGESRKPDQYAAFRGTFDLAADGNITLHVFGAHVFTVWLDGEYLTEGPYRFPLSHPEYETVEVSLKRERHVVAAVVRHEGIETRMLQSQLIPPFFMLQAQADQVNIPISWKAAPLPGYIASGQRLSPQFAWIEWLDTRLNPDGWQQPDFDDAKWNVPAEVAEVRTWNLQPVDAERLKRLKIAPKLIGEGKLSGPFEHKERPGWQTDDGFPWYQRNLAPKSEANGIWRRYDLGFVMLGVPEITIETPAGTVVEIAYSESLMNGRVTPFIPLSVGPSRNMDHFVSRGGVQTFSPVVPKGGRYLEIHVGAAAAQAKIKDVVYWRRAYFEEPVGEFRCDDELLNRVWQLGIDTLRSCSEDAIIDNPTRERGQWTGDVLLALHIASAGYNDVRLFKRGLRHSAYCARPDGLVAGLSPGGPGYLSTYSAQWITAAVNYAKLTGDRDLLVELFPYAERNMEVFINAMTPEGIPNFEWPFVDWGYPGSQGSSTEMALNMHVIDACWSMSWWCDFLGKKYERFSKLRQHLYQVVSDWLKPLMSKGCWEEIDFHCTTQGLRLALIPEDEYAAAIAYLKRHILSCFPNDLAAPSLANPDFKRSQLITPYFAYYYIPELVRLGEIDFVLEQFRTCWGWGLNQGLTTQPEVFDLNWSHCHVWASSPTALLTQYLIGLVPHYMCGRNHYDFTLNPGSVPRATGKIPLIGGEGAIAVSWERDGNQIVYNVNAPESIWIHNMPTGGAVHVIGKQTLKVDLPAPRTWSQQG